MSNLTYALIIVLVLNGLMFLGQESINEIRGDENIIFTDCQNGVLLGDCQNSYIDFSDPASILPNTNSEISKTEGTTYTDTPSAISSFFLDTLGIKYIVGIISAPYNILSGIGLPKAVAFALGSIWYGITLFLLMAFIFGRDA